MYTSLLQYKGDIKMKCFRFFMSIAFMFAILLNAACSPEAEGGNGNDTPLPQLDAPAFSIAGGTYTNVQTVVLTAAEGSIYYTTDGSDPVGSATRTEYSSAISVWPVDSQLPCTQLSWSPQVLPHEPQWFGSSCLLTQ